MAVGLLRSAAAVTTVLVIVAACSPSASVAPSPAGSQTTSSSPTTTTPASIAASPGAVPTPIAAWQRSPDQAALLDIALETVVWTGSRFLATARGGDAAILDSVDGRAWHRQPPFAITARTSGPRLVAAAAEGVIAVGGGFGGPFAIWQSADGLAWTQAPDQDAFQVQDGAFEDIDAVIATDDGWLAVGSAAYNCVPRCPLRALVMTSRDGLHWTRQADQPALRYAAMHAVVRGQSGYVAVGTVMVDPKHGEAGLRAASWTSPDGRDWQIGAPPAFAVPAGWADDGPTDVELRGIAMLGGRLVALGDVRTSSASDLPYTPPVAIAWWSDGATWTPVMIGPFAEHEPITLADLPNGLLAITGSDAACSSGVWASGDGGSWRCNVTDPAFDGFIVSGAVASPDTAVLVGYGTGDPTVGAAWTLALR